MARREAELPRFNEPTATGVMCIQRKLKVWYGSNLTKEQNAENLVHHLNVLF